METKEIIQSLSSIPVGTIIAWFTIIGGAITGIVTGTIKLYKIFEKTHEIKSENKEFMAMVKAHDEQLKNMNDVLISIQKRLEERDATDLSKMRYSIVRAGEEYVSVGHITIRQLRSLEELYDTYHNKRHANGYVTTLMTKVRKLPVIGKLDENEEDID